MNDESKLYVLNCGNCLYNFKSRCHAAPMTWTLFGYRFPKINPVEWCSCYSPGSDIKSTIRADAAIGILEKIPSGGSNVTN